MNSAPIPDDLRRFILSCIPSIPYLEAILLMHNEPTRQWGVTDVAQRLFINEKRTDTILQQLLASGIVKISNQWPILYQFNSQNGDLKAMIDKLAAAYSTNLVEISNLIHSNMDQNAHKFANAFIWKKDT